jgi:hypothetical protein
MDFPMSGNFLGHFEFDTETQEKWGTPDAIGQTLGNHLQARRSRHPGLPRAAFGFSAGAAIAGMPQLNEQFDIFVLIGPVIPVSLRVMSTVAIGYSN